jgi:DNA-binding MltR family transcriptional regulator
MLINGKKLDTPNIEYCIIPRGNAEDIILKACAVLDMSPFEKLCPPPKPVIKRLPGNKKVEDVESPIYKAHLQTWNNKRVAYMVIKSLEATEELVWEKVNLSNPDTWELYESELRESGFSEIEIMRILNTVMSANCLNETRIEQARNAFLLLQAQKEEDSSFQMGEQGSIQSGELANA